MTLTIRDMREDEVHLMVDYFHAADDDFLGLLGVDRALLPDRDQWIAALQKDLEVPPGKRSRYMLLWEQDDAPVGFSTVTDIDFGEQAFLHQHVLKPENRRSGVASHCLKQSIAHYFDVLEVKRLFSEPNAFNTGPNRSLQKAGFRFVKTYETQPGPLNTFQTVNRWVLER